MRVPSWLRGLHVRRHSPRWFLGDANGDVHVLPQGDLIDHEAEDCICGPTVEPCPREDGSMGWLVTHHTLDNREAGER